MRKFDSYYVIEKELLEDTHSIFSTITGKFILEGLSKKKADSFLTVLNFKKLLYEEKLNE